MIVKRKGNRITGMGSDFNERNKIPETPPELNHKRFAAGSVLIGLLTYGANIYLLLDVLLFHSSLYNYEPFMAFVILGLIAIANILNAYVLFYTSSRLYGSRKNIFVKLIYTLFGLCGFASVILLIECIFLHHFIPFPYEIYAPFLTKEEIETELKNANKSEEKLKFEKEALERQQREEEEKKKKEEKEKKENDEKEGKEKKDEKKDDETKTNTKENDKNDENKNAKEPLLSANSQDKDKDKDKNKDKDRKESKKEDEDDDDDDDGGIVGISGVSKKPKKAKSNRITIEESMRLYEEKKRKKELSKDPKKMEEEEKRIADMKRRDLQLQMDPIELWLENTQDITKYNNDGTSETPKEKNQGILVRVENDEESRVLMSGFRHSDRIIKKEKNKTYNYDYYQDDYYNDYYGYGGYRNTSSQNAISDRMPGIQACEFATKEAASARLRFIAAKLVTFERSRAIECFFVSMPMVAVTLYMLCFENMRFVTDDFVNGIIWISFSFNLLNIANEVPRWIQANFLFTSAKSRYSNAMKDYDWMNWQRSVWCGIYFAFDIIIRVLPWLLYCQIDEFQPKSYYMLPLITFGCEFVLVFMATQYWRWYKNNFAPTKDLFSLIGNALLSLFSQYFFFSHRTWNVFCGIEILARYISSVVLFSEYVEYNLNERIVPDDVWGVVYLCVLCTHIVWGCIWSTVRYEWLRDLDDHLQKQQKSVQVPRKPNVHSTSLTESVPCSLELFSTSLIPGFVPETAIIMKHYRRKEEYLLKTYVESDDARIRELQRRKEQHREQLQQWAESEQKVKEEKLKREKMLQEQLSKGQLKSTLTKQDKSAFAKDFDAAFRKKAGKDGSDARKGYFNFKGKNVTSAKKEEESKDEAKNNEDDDKKDDKKDEEKDDATIKEETKDDKVDKDDKDDKDDKPSNDGNDGNDGKEEKKDDKKENENDTTETAYSHAQSAIVEEEEEEVVPASKAATKAASKAESDAPTAVATESEAGGSETNDGKSDDKDKPELKNQDSLGQMIEDEIVKQQSDYID